MDRIGVCIIGLLILFNVFTSEAQGYSGYFMGGTSHVIKHSKKSTFKNPPSSYFLQIGLRFKPGGKRSWQRYWNNPEIGLNAIYLDFGNKETLGQALGVFPSIGNKIAGNSNFQFSWRIGSGLAYLNKHYDKIHNPLNNAIGSNFNNVTQLSLLLERKLFPQTSILMGVNFTHFSNARTTTPNAGINSGNLSLGLVQKLGLEASKPVTELDTLVRNRKIGGDFLLGYGISEYSFTGGPKYASYFVNIGGYYSISPFFKVLLGGEYEYNQSVFQFYFQDFDPEEIARKKATKLAIYSAAELRFGIVGARFQAGYYLPYPDVREVTSTFYTKLNLNIYPCPRKWEVQPYFGVLLKSHAQVAQYLGLVIGAEI